MFLPHHFPCWRPTGLLLVLLLIVAGAGPARAQAGPPLRARFFHLLDAGDSVYARKDGYRGFARAQRYYDSAQVLADRSQDTLLLAEAVFARGRVYDAWNKEPQKTVAYFQRASNLFARLPSQQRRYFYATFLLAHAYDKVPDSLRTVQVLRRLRRELLNQPDSLLRQVPTTVEMALTATQVRNYPLADTILSQLVHRAWVRNDPDTYDYLTHYYLVQARLDVRHRQRLASPYLDSLAWAARRTAHAFDRVYYGSNLAELYAEAGQYAAAYATRTRTAQLSDSLSDGGEVAEVRQSLLQSQEQADQGQRQYEAVRQRTRTLGLWGLSTGLAIISLLSVYLYRHGRASRVQARQLAALNSTLDAQVAQVELLNKEIQHRVKNNLHMIFSLLHMQERQTDNEEVIENLQAARLRVESIAALQNQLLRNPNVPDLTAFLKHLISAVVSCLANDRQVMTHLVTEDLHLTVNSYFALSLILNEWVTNSIKYADPPDNIIEVNVSVKQHPEAVLIEYFDNGRVPTTAPASGPDASGLGTQIITLLSQQLGATLTTRPDAPYHYQLRIPNGA